jgi:alkanesulfonate monooxygenase SsuD/methylene tetrahydromethanopterin reductase-like flavin-dependent oxidoreductase (luciferase family)
MSDLTFGLFVRGQYHAGDDMRERFEEVKAQVRLADQLGFSDLLTGMHYAAAPLQQYQMIPLLARLLAETERMRIITGIIPPSLHKPPDIAEQLATLT